jgi:uncharacterized protein (DUF2062 family)
MGTYLVRRATRLAGTPHSIAAGAACGVAISFTPLIGLHLLGAFLLCLLVRGNYLAAAAGTLVGNPWTFPFIWVATDQLGHALMGSPPAQLEPVQHWDLANARRQPSRGRARGPRHLLPDGADGRSLSAGTGAAATEPARP